MGRNTEISIQDDNGLQVASYKVHMDQNFFENEQKVKKGAKICEWDPYTTPVIAEKDGIANYVDLIDGVSIAETVDDATGISTKAVVDWKTQSKNTDLKPRITLRDDKGNVIKKADDNGLDTTYSRFNSSVKDGQKISAGDVIARLPKETTKTKDITEGYLELQNFLKLEKPRTVQLLQRMMVV